ncbi:MAG: hypothetical protein NVS3B6_21460 [Pseudarthrobacter sp.]
MVSAGDHTYKHALIKRPEGYIPAMSDGDFGYSSRQDQDAATGPGLGCGQVDPGGDGAVQEEATLFGVRVLGVQGPFADDLVVGVRDPVVIGSGTEGIGEGLQRSSRV